jgi:hypothetical protein
MILPHQDQMMRLTGKHLVFDLNMHIFINQLLN